MCPFARLRYALEQCACARQPCMDIREGVCHLVCCGFIAVSCMHDRAVIIWRPPCQITEQRNHMGQGDSSKCCKTAHSHRGNPHKHFQRGAAQQPPSPADPSVSVPGPPTRTMDIPSLLHGHCGRLSGGLLKRWPGDGTQNQNQTRRSELAPRASVQPSRAQIYIDVLEIRTTNIMRAPGPIIGAQIHQALRKLCGPAHHPQQGGGR